MAKSGKNHPDKTKRAGEVRHDARGHAVWHWATETARNAAISTSQLLRRLDVSGLSLEDEPPPDAPGKSGSDKPVPGKPTAGKGPNPAPAQPASPKAAAAKSELKLSEQARKGSGGGYNPYDGAAVPRAPVARNRLAAPDRPRASWWRRLFQRR